MLLPQSIERIIARGGNVTLDASRFLPQQLERFAAIANSAGVTVSLKNCNRILPQTLERIAQQGGGRIHFIFDE